MNGGDEVDAPKIGSRTRGYELDARFVENVSPHLNLLACSASRHASNPRDAEDLFQETLLKAYVGFASFREGSNIKAWLFQIMKRTAIDVYRAAQRRPTELLAGQTAESFAFGGMRNPSRAMPSAEIEMFDATIGDELRQAICDLTEPLRIVVYYAAIEGRTYSDIATILGVPTGTVMSRIHRARERLRAQLADAACPEVWEDAEGPCRGEHARIAEYDPS